ncbi:MAG: hypothetical protein E6J91_38435 [Deltaproteobacteria bacterium]|nr:MAG: hypothetical protein E6J91_38435 [Deltaproteobacteria bacterium]
MSQQNYRHLVVFSGGLDSTTVAWMLKGEAPGVLLYYLYHGHRRQAAQVNMLAERLGMRVQMWNIIELMAILTAPGCGYVPGYRAIGYVSALAMADRFDIPFLYTGELEAPFYSWQLADDPEVRHYEREKKVGVGGYTGREGSIQNRSILATWYGEKAYRDPRAFRTPSRARTRASYRRASITAAHAAAASAGARGSSWQVSRIRRRTSSYLPCHRST